MSTNIVQNEQLLSFNEVAARLSLKSETIKKYRSKGMPFFSDQAVRIAGSVRWRSSDLDAYIAGLAYATDNDQ